VRGGRADEMEQSTSLSSATDTYHKISRGELSSATNATKALAEHGGKADTSTGTTPRKRVWQYVDQWELTKSRTELLQTWRATGVSAAGSDTFLAEHRPLPEPEVEEEEDVDAMIVDEGVRSPLSESGSSSESPAAVSLASSASSNALPPPRQIPVPKKIGVGVGSRPAIAPLTDTRNVYTTRRRGR